MWIRSQDKTELIDTKRMQVDGKDIYAFEGVAIEDGNYIRMGIYKSQKRALEVLDEIHDQLINATRCDVIVNGERITKLAVYQMPEK